MPNLFVIFTTGLLTGGLTCMAVQGSLLATAILNAEAREGAGRGRRIAAILSFITAKTLAYTILGAFLGWLGSFFQFSITLQIFFSLLVAVFMIGSALSILDAHPVFRHFNIRPPRFLSRFIRNRSKGADIFMPFVLGALTVFIPCGSTQAMMVFAMGTGNPLWGSLVMLSFTLGTAPLFMVLGYGVGELKGLFRDRFRPIAAAAIIVLALWNVNSILKITGSGYDAKSIGARVQCVISFCDETSRLAGVIPTDSPVITFNREGYHIDNPVIRTGETIKVRLINSDGYGCIQAFTIPKLGIREVVPVGEERIVTFTAPLEPGTLPFMCSMGMYEGAFHVTGGI